MLVRRCCHCCSVKPPHRELSTLKRTVRCKLCPECLRASKLKCAYPGHDTHRHQRICGYQRYNAAHRARESLHGRVGGGHRGLLPVGCHQPVSYQQLNRHCSPRSVL